MLLNVLSGVFLISGFFFLAVGTVGLVRLPDTYTRLHATGKCDTLGALLTVLGCAFMVRQPAQAAKLLAVAAFLWVINPATTHMIARCARARNIPMVAGTKHRTQPHGARKGGTPHVS